MPQEMIMQKRGEGTMKNIGNIRTQVWVEGIDEALEKANKYLALMRQAQEIAMGLSQWDLKFGLGSQAEEGQVADDQMEETLEGPIICLNFSSAVANKGAIDQRLGDLFVGRSEQLFLYSTHIRKGEVLGTAVLDQDISEDDEIFFKKIGHFAKETIERKDLGKLFDYCAKGL